MKYLPGQARIAFGNRRLRAALTVGMGEISIRPGDCRQPGAPAANESRPLCDGEPRFKRPIGNLPGECARGSQRIQPLVFQRVGYDGLQDSARSPQRQVIVPLLEGTPTIGVGLLDNGPELGVVNEIEPARRRCFRRFRNGLAIVHSGERGNGLLEDVEQSLDDLGWRRPFDRKAGC